MINNYIRTTKLKIDITSRNKATNLLDGTYQSAYKGKSQIFDELREYNVGDDVKDIDWHASARSNSVLVKEHISQKKHNFMFVVDSKCQMYANANPNDLKCDIAANIVGTLGYISYKNGDYVGLIYTQYNDIVFYPFKQTLSNIENSLNNYSEDIKKNFKRRDQTSINKSLDYLINFTKKRMIIIIITDLSGLEEIDEELIKVLSFRNDVMIINIADINLFEKKSYDLDKRKYFASMFLHKKRLAKLETNEKQKVYEYCEKKYLKYKIPMININSIDEIVEKIIELLERNKYVSTK